MAKKRDEKTESPKRVEPLTKDQPMTAEEKVNNFFHAHRKAIFIILGVLAVLLVVFIMVVIFYSAQKNKATTEIEQLMLDFNKVKSEKIKNSLDELTDEEKRILAEEEDKLLESLKAHTAGKGYASFVANSEIAEIYFNRKDWENALLAYEAAAKFQLKAYTAGVAYFNAGTCADELGDFEKAFDYYKKASEVESFPLASRAFFNSARVQEQLDKEKAIEIYKKLVVDFPDSEWANLSKTRIIQLSQN